VKALQALGYEAPVRRWWSHLFVAEMFSLVGKACLPLVFDSLCSQTDNHSIVVVVAPLTVMQDQVVSFTERGLKCAYITGIRKL
jgi:hypothetical protein